jgi:agmatinase
MHGGFLYYEVAELLQGIAKKGKVIGMDLVELTPAKDPSGITAILAVRVIFDLIRFVFEE